MRDPRINFRTRELAALLAFLVPGAGHFYQGRRLKAGIYFTCILTLFFAGMVLGDWQPVYSQVVYAKKQGTTTQMQPREGSFGSNYSIGYAAQVLVGLPALPALIQQSRFSSDSAGTIGLDSELNSDFSGVLRERNGAVFLPVTGQLILTPGKGAKDVVGTFEGRLRDGSPVSGQINGAAELGKDVFGSPRREIQVRGYSGAKAEGIEPTQMWGTVSRPFYNWFQAPRDNTELDRLHGKLSQHFDIACVFTWIAGLLNLMAIWDAYDGPAYGYGDEEPEDEDDDESAPSKTKSS